MARSECGRWVEIILRTIKNNRWKPQASHFTHLLQHVIFDNILITYIMGWLKSISLYLLFTMSGFKH